jgi:diketogulonate reductase-like aldo/keto reductase
MLRSVTFPDQTAAPALGQGTWRMGEDARLRQQEITALRAGIDLGMSLIDTAEMYGDGAAESLLGEAIAGAREQVFLVSKVYPQNAGRGRIERACEASLQRLKTDHLDLYLLHWRGQVPLAETIEGMDALIRAGKIRRWGVSNFDAGDMDQLVRAGGESCATDQLLYNVTERGAEFDLLPQLRKRAIPTMAYSPVGQGRLPQPPALSAVAKRHGVTPSKSRSPGCFAIPRSSRSRRLRTWRTSRRTAAPWIWCLRPKISRRSMRTSRRLRARPVWRCSDARGGALWDSGPIPPRIGRRASHPPGEIRRTVQPPHGPAFAQADLGCLNPGPGIREGRAVGAPTCGSDIPPRHHELVHKPGAGLRG